MKHFTIRKILLVLGIATSVAVVPTTASAKASVHISLPGISIGLGDRHYQSRYYNNRYRSYQYVPSYRYVPRTTYRYQNQYYNSPSRRIYTPSYQSAACPEPGYSPNYYAGHGCRQHLDHYHCD